MSIQPTLLIEQVKSAAPFLFDGAEPAGPSSRYLRVLRSYDGRRLNPLEYYELCLCAHWLCMDRRKHCGGSDFLSGSRVN